MKCSALIDNIVHFRTAEQQCASELLIYLSCAVTVLLEGLDGTVSRYFSDKEMDEQRINSVLLCPASLLLAPELDPLTQ